MSERETSKGGYEVTASIHGSLTLHANNINKEQIKDSIGTATVIHNAKGTAISQSLLNAEIAALQMCLRKLGHDPTLEKSVGLSVAGVSGHRLPNSSVSSQQVQVSAPISVRSNTALSRTGVQSGTVQRTAAPLPQQKDIQQPHQNGDALEKARDQQREQFQQDIQRRWIEKQHGEEERNTLLAPVGTTRIPQLEALSKDELIDANDLKDLWDETQSQEAIFYKPIDVTTGSAQPAAATGNGQKYATTGSSIEAAVSSKPMYPPPIIKVTGPVGSDLYSPHSKHPKNYNTYANAQTLSSDNGYVNSAGSGHSAPFKGGKNVPPPKILPLGSTDTNNSTTASELANQQAKKRRL